jgi:hypothetical protein
VLASTMGNQIAFYSFHFEQLFIFIFFLFFSIHASIDVPPRWLDFELASKDSTAMRQFTPIHGITDAQVNSYS